MSDHWIEGRFEGTYEGERVAPASDRDGPRRFSFRLRSGEVRDASVVDGPFPDTASGTETRAIRQDRVGRIRLCVPPLDLDRRDTSLFDVHIVDWRLSRPAEAGGRSHGCIEGTIRARLLPPQPEPAAEETAEAESTVEGVAARRPAEAPAHERPIAQPAGTPMLEAPTPPVSDARVHEARRRTHPDDWPAKAGSTLVEAADAETIYDRLRWLAATCLVLGIAAGLWGACGGRIASIWLAPTLGALCLRRVAGRAIRAGSPSQGVFAAALVTAQAVLWLEPVARGADFGCHTPDPMQLAGLGSAVVAAALLRGRSALFATTAVWTACMCAWCVALGGTCSAVVVTTDPAAAAASAEHRPGPRTSPDGHWPVMPGRRQATVSGGAAASGSGMASGSGAETNGHGAIDWTPGSAGAAPVTGADGPTSAGAPVTPGGDAPLARSDASMPTRPASASDTPAPSRRGAAASTRGGWVAADHRRASAGAELISIEHANRVPEAFFESGGARRVYVPTDAIFEPGSAAIRSTGTLQLGRVAALLDLHPERRTMLTIHTDVGGGGEAQQRLSERQAASVRGWLIDRGHVDAERFAIVGVGAAHPLVPPDGSYAAQQPNRRIEISLAE